ncbi:EXS family protein [Spraguea lophii 42_110]|uniref:EXS family protein n=1 Tax=Spraguea lophii (strain 42_110) TaxID=1358809 RepID=S7XG22_SPRLO|nr:EXS family protein [Spraguea lophii 42_110]
MEFYKYFKQRGIIPCKKSYINYKELRILAKNYKRLFIEKLMDNIIKVNNTFQIIINNCLNIQKETMKPSMRKIKEDPIFTQTRLSQIKKIYLKIYDGRSLTPDEKEFYKEIFVEHKLEREKMKNSKKTKKTDFKCEYDRYDDNEDMIPGDDLYSTMETTEHENYIDRDCLDDENIQNKEKNKKNNEVSPIKSGFLTNVNNKIRTYFTNINNNKNKRKTIIFLEILNDLINFQKINKEAIFKLLKIYSKNHEDNSSSYVFSDDIKYILSKIMFSTSPIPNMIFEKIEKYYTINFPGDNKQFTVNMVPNILLRKNIDSYKIYLSGGLSTLSIFLFIEEVTKNTTSRLFQLFLNIQLILLGFWLFGVSKAIFDEYKIDYDFVWGWNITSNFTAYTHIFIFSIAMFINHIIYFTLNNFNFYNDYFYCTILSAISIITFTHLLPYWIPRKYFYEIIMKQILAPFCTLRFRLFFVADILISYSECFRNLFSVYLYNNSYVLISVAAFPFVLRMLQCGRRMYDEKRYFIQSCNVIKYLLSFISLFFVLFKDNSNIVKIIGAGVLGVSTLVNLLWDFKMDWGIDRKKKLFPLFWYILICCYDICVRILWIVTYFQIFTRFCLPIAFLCAEIIRRFLWALIRVELEHLNNCDQLDEGLTVSWGFEDLFYVKKKYKY